MQEAFEHLIEQLEQLRNIYELTSANAESAKMVIGQMDGFVKSSAEYKKQLEEELNSKSRTIDQIFSSLATLISRIEAETRELSKNVTDAFNGYKEETKIALKTHLTEIENASVSFIVKFKSWQAEMNYKFEQSERNVIVNQIKSTDSLSTKLSENNLEVTNQLHKQDKEIKMLKSALFIGWGLIVLGTIVIILVLKKAI